MDSSLLSDKCAFSPYTRLHNPPPSLPPVTSHIQDPLKAQSVLRPQLFKEMLSLDYTATTHHSRDTLLKSCKFLSVLTANISRRAFAFTAPTSCIFASSILKLIFSCLSFHVKLSAYETLSLLIQYIRATNGLHIPLFYIELHDGNIIIFIFCLLLMCGVLLNGNYYRTLGYWIKGQTIRAFCNNMQLNNARECLISQPS